MTILETFIKLRDDLKLWVTNNLNQKANISYVDEKFDSISEFDPTEIQEAIDANTTAIDTKVDKVDGKGLSTNDYTAADKDKLSTVEANANFYEHPVHDSHNSGLYKVTVDDEGHVSGATLASKEDIVALGIPEQDTTYEEEISDLNDRIDGVEGDLNTTNETLNGLSEEFEDYKTTNNGAVSTNTSNIEANKASIEEIQSDYLTSTDKNQLEDEIEEVFKKATANASAIEVLNGEGEGSVKQSIDNAFNEFAANVTNDDIVNTYKELIDYAAKHGPEFTELVGKVDNINTNVGEVKGSLSDYKTEVSERFAEADEIIKDHVSNTNNPHGVTKKDLDLENVDNTADLDKPISNATQDALDEKANLEHDHNDLYYDKGEIEGLITIEDIDDICGFQQVSGGDISLIGYATEQWVRDIFQIKGDYLTADELSDEINAAIAQAKANGEFSGIAITNYIREPIDFNEVVSAGVYNVLNSALEGSTNYPSTVGGVLTVKSKPGAEYPIVQELHNSKRQFFIRYKTSIGWSDWDSHASERWVSESYQPKGDYLVANKLPEAINTALEQAKASGKFDGKDGALISGTIKEPMDFDNLVNAGSYNILSSAIEGSVNYPSTVGGVFTVKSIPGKEYPIVHELHDARKQFFIRYKTSFGWGSWESHALESWVSENYQVKGDYLTQHQDISGKLDANKLPEAVNAALAQAKQSGEFDGKDGAEGLSIFYANFDVDYVESSNGIPSFSNAGISLYDIDNGDRTIQVGDLIISRNGTLCNVVSVDSMFVYVGAQCSITGENGSDGITPHIGENGNWFIGDTDTGLPSCGRDGATITAYIREPMDFDNVVDAGIYNVLNSAIEGSVNYPSTVGGVLTVKSMSGSEYPVVQELHNSRQQFFIRYKTSLGWGSWETHSSEKWVSENFQPKGNYLTSVPNGYAKIEDIPTNISEFTNDAGYLTEHQSLDGLATESFVNNQIAAIPTPDVSGQINSHNVATDSHNDIRLLVEDLTTRLNTLANSDDTTLDQMSEVVAYIKNNKSLIEGITTDKINVSDIINNLTTNVTNKPLSAAQGVALKAIIDNIVVPTKVSELTNDSGFLTSIPSEYVTESELNAKGYLTEHQSLAAYAKTADLGALAKKDSLTATEVGARPNTWTPSASDVGLGNVDNTSDANKPVSTAQANAIADAKKAGTDAQSNLTTHINNKSNPHNVTKSQVGLSNVDNVRQYSAENPPVVFQSEAPTDTSVIWVDTNDNYVDEFSDMVNMALAHAKESGEFKGDKPVKGVDYWTEADQEAIVQQVIAALGTPVFGTVDENKVVKLKGDFTDGTYRFVYEDKNGKVTEIGTANVAGVVDESGVVTLVFAHDTKIDKTTGAESFDGSYAATDFVAYNDQYEHLLTLKSKGSTYIGAGVCWYDSNKAFVGWNNPGGTDFSAENSTLDFVSVTRAITPMANSAYFKLRIYCVDFETTYGKNCDVILEKVKI